jgi:surface polysaccharide O-acyltransferase-like enzyme
MSSEGRASALSILPAPPMTSALRGDGFAAPRSAPATLPLLPAPPAAVSPAHAHSDASVHARSGAKAASAQLVTWNRLRVFACFDVVGFHLTLEHPVAGIGLPIALMVSFALGVRHERQPPLRKFFSVRVQRLLLPWLFWSASFAGILMLSALRKGDPLHSRLAPNMLLYGTAECLWFLPAMAVFGVLAYLVDRHTRNVPDGLYLTVCAAASAFLLQPALQVSEQLIYPLPQWRFALSAFPLGLLLGRLLMRGRRELWLGAFALATVATLGLIVGKDAPFEGPNFIAIRFTLSCALLALGGLLPGKPDAVTSRIEPLLLGIYMLHVLVYDYVVTKAFRALGYTEPAVLLVVTFVLSGLLVVGLKRTPLRKVL